MFDTAVEVRAGSIYFQRIVYIMRIGAAAQFVPAPTDLIEKLGYANISVRYKEVPTGICEVSPQRNSKSGLRTCECLLTAVEAGSQCQELLGICRYCRRSTHLLVVLRGAEPGSLRSTSHSMDQWWSRIFIYDWIISRTWPLWCWPRRKAFQQPILVDERQ